MNYSPAYSRSLPPLWRRLADAYALKLNRVIAVLLAVFLSVASVVAPVKPSGSTSASADVSYRSWAECAAALPVTQALRAPQPLWYESSNPHSARSSLDRPDSTVYLWLGLLGIPLAIYAWLLSLLRARQTQTARQSALGLVATGAGDRLRWPLRFVKLTQTPFARKAVVYLIFVLLLSGFVGQFFWAVERKQSGAERVRAAAGGVRQ